MIFVDFREEKSGILEVLNNLGLETKKITLEVGDYVISGHTGVNVCVERKTASDYIGSLVSGHLNNQLVQMSKNYPFSILLIEGSIAGALLESGVRRQTVYSSLVGSCLKRAPIGESGFINIIPVDTIYDTGLVLKYLQQKLTDSKGLIRTLKINPVHFSKEEVGICMLSTIPGIGQRLAKNILSKLHTLQNVANASESELREIPKVGPKKSSTIFEFFRFFYK